MEEVKIDIDESKLGPGYDDSNLFVLPSRKVKNPVVVHKQKNVRILTKKQRKQLQKIVDKKKKKEARADVLSALANVQISSTELQQYTSISQVQTLGVKKFPKLESILAKKEQKSTNHVKSSSGKISSIKGARKRPLLIEEKAEIDAKKKNPNFVGIESESETESDNDDIENCDAKELQVSNISSIEVNEPPTSAKPTVKESSVEAKNTENNTNSALKTNDSATVSKVNVKSRPSTYVPVQRHPDIQASRLKLPILAEEQQIMETISENDITIIAGETGSGKTTQLPQFLYEAGYAKNHIIGITEPRRVAAIAMSKRVAMEMSLSNTEVSYLIRYEGNVTAFTKIKFMTDGVLLKEIENDFLLQKYSVIILDEAHERSAYTDILIGLLSRIVPLRNNRKNPLKLIIMSATLRVADFTNNRRLFESPPPVINVETRQFPVTIHFQKTTPTNYVHEAFRKVVKIHSKLPEGGILVFLTGQMEVNALVRKLRKAFPYENKNNKKKQENVQESEDGIKNSKINENLGDEDDNEFDIKKAVKKLRNSKKKFLKQLALPNINLDDYKLPINESDTDSADNNNDDDDCNSSDGLESDDDENDVDDENVAGTKQPLWVLPLYTLLSSEKQNRIFQPSPDECRLCVVSTNVAETSLTIPNIKYVVDSGRHKMRIYDKVTGVTSFVIAFTSKASADQRAGRAGRTSAGHCYRLYSSAVYNDEFENFAVPDIQKKPVDDLMLQMRCMGIDKVINFPFPSPPDEAQLIAAEQRLIILGALESRKGQKDSTPSVTLLGRSIARFPVSPNFGKMLALSHQHNLMPYAVCLVAGLTVKEIFIETVFDAEKNNSSDLIKKWKQKRRSWAASGNYHLLGDPMVILRAIGAAECAAIRNNLAQFCTDNGLRHKAVVEVRQLRKKLTNEININTESTDLTVDPNMVPPTDTQARLLRQIILSGLGDRVARKVPLTDITDKAERRRLKYAYNCADMVEPVFMHSSSVLSQVLPEWVIYQEAYEIDNGDSRKMFIRGITAIEPEWLTAYVPKLCNIREICEDPAPRYNSKTGKVICYVNATFGKAAWQLPLAETDMPLSEKACCYFGMFLLDGQVFPELMKYKSKLKATPGSLLKSWSDRNECVAKFKSVLKYHSIYTLKSLLDAWEKDSNILLNEYCNMLYNVSRSELLSSWPPAAGQNIEPQIN